MTSTTSTTSTTISLWTDGDSDSAPALATQLTGVGSGLCHALQILDVTADAAGFVTSLTAEAVPVQPATPFGDLEMEHGRVLAGTAILTIERRYDPEVARARAVLSIIDTAGALIPLGDATGEVDPDQVGGLSPIEVDEPGTCGESYLLAPLTDPIIARVWESEDAQRVLRREHPAQLA